MCPNLGEESGCGLTYRFQVSWGWEPGFRFQISDFKFQVSRYFVPLSQGDEEQSSGGGLSTAVPVLRSCNSPLRPSGTSPNLGEESEGMTNGNVKGEAMS